MPEDQPIRNMPTLTPYAYYEEFNDDCSGIDYRMDVSLPFLYQVSR